MLIRDINGNTISRDTKTISNIIFNLQPGFKYVLDSTNLIMVTFGPEGRQVCLRPIFNDTEGALHQYVLDHGVEYHDPKTMPEHDPSTVWWCDDCDGVKMHDEVHPVTRIAEEYYCNDCGNVVCEWEERDDECELDLDDRDGEALESVYGPNE